MTTRGFISPRRSQPRVANEDSVDKINHRFSNTSSLDISKSTTKAVSSRQQSNIVEKNPSAKKLVNNYILSTKSAPESSLRSAAGFSQRTLKSPRKATPSKGNEKAAIGSRAKPNVATRDGASYKYFDSPAASPKHFLSSGEDDDTINILHTNSINESVDSDTKEENNSQSNIPPILFKIYEEIASHRQGNSSIISYFRNLKALWNEPTANYSDLHQSSSDAIVKQSELMEREKLMQFLLGLNVSYSSLCSQILLLRPSPTVEKAYSIILREHKLRKSKRNSIQ